MVEKAKEKVLIIGASGLLGRALCKELLNNFHIFSPSEKELDITDRLKIQAACRELRPNIIILTAAYTDVDGCEENPEIAYKVNVEGVRNVVEIAIEVGAALIFLSTDYVFNGESKRAYTEEDRPDPISVYARSKVQAESIIKANLKRAVIIRSSWLFGEGEKGFVQFVIKSVDQKKILKIVSDKIGSPTYVVDLASAINEIVKLIVDGKYDFQNNRIIHIVNNGSCSWFGMAEFIIHKIDGKDVELKEIALSEFPFKAKRPKYSALNNSLYKKITGGTLRSWQEALGEFISAS